MEELKKYIHKITGIDLLPVHVETSMLGKLPFFIRQSFNFYHAILFGQPLLLVKVKGNSTIRILQTANQLKQVQSVFKNKILVLVIENLDALGRYRLIDKRINFIVPGKQLFIPSMMIDLQESFTISGTNNGKLLPSAQLIIFYKILKRNDQIEKYNLKEIASVFHYSQMAITKAVRNLELHGLCTTTGTKNKYLEFAYDIPRLWNIALPLMASPVYRKLYVDDLPETKLLFKSNESALPLYSDMAESRQAYYAVEKNLFYEMKKKGRWTNLNETEGAVCLEIWKYNPALLANNDHVDPLSLYMSLKELGDERVEMALEQIIEQYIW